MPIYGTATRRDIRFLGLTLNGLVVQSGVPAIKSSPTEAAKTKPPPVSRRGSR